MERTVFVLVIGFMQWISNCYSYEFPEILAKCSIGDTTCIKDRTNIVLKDLSHGFSGINLVPIQPLNIPAIELYQGSESPVNIKLKFKAVELHGLHNYMCTKIEGFGPNPEGNYLIELKGPVLTLVGPYEISGRILILPIQGSGRSNITIINPVLKIKFSGKTKTRKGKEYLYIDDLKLTFTTTRIYTHLSNLYNGDVALGQSTNLFLNENWQDIFAELKQSIFEAFTLIVQNLLNNIFHKVPYTELFAN